MFWRLVVTRCVSHYFTDAVLAGVVSDLGDCKSSGSSEISATSTTTAIATTAGAAGSSSGSSGSGTPSVLRVTAASQINSADGYPDTDLTGTTVQGVMVGRQYRQQVVSLPRRVPGARVVAVLRASADGTSTDMQMLFEGTTVLCRAVLCCAVLCCAVLCCAKVLYCAVVYCALLCSLPITRASN